MKTLILFLFTLSLSAQEVIYKANADVRNIIGATTILQPSDSSINLITETDDKMEHGKHYVFWFKILEVSEKSYQIKVLGFKPTTAQIQREQKEEGEKFKGFTVITNLRYLTPVYKQLEK